MDLKETDILGDSIGEHWYYCSKAAATTRMLGDASIKRILDVGAGSGFFSHHLLTHSAAREAWCVDISYPADSSASTAGKPVHYRRSVDALDADLVLLMDVLEHVDDDLGLLKSYVDKVPSGSRFLMTVPAFQFMWSGHDDFLEHKRRYTLAQFETLAGDAGLTVQRARISLARCSRLRRRCACCPVLRKGRRRARNSSAITRGSMRCSKPCAGLSCHGWPAIAWRV